MPGVEIQCNLIGPIEGSSFSVFTVHNEVVKVMFLHLSVCSQGRSLPQCRITPPQSRHKPPWSRHPPGADTPLEQAPPWKQTPRETRHPPANGYCCGRYASYRNAFLFSFYLVKERLFLNINTHFQDSAKNPVSDDTFPLIASFQTKRCQWTKIYTNFFTCIDEDHKLSLNYHAF